MIKSRLLFVFLLFLIFFVAVIVKLIDIQIIKKDELQYFAQRQHVKEEKILPLRGLIYDRNNILLAYNRSDYSIFVDKRQLTKKSTELICEQFSKLYNRNKTHFISLIRKSDRNIVSIDKKTPVEKALLLQNFKKAGVFAEPNPSRIYQYQNLASHILGYVDADFEGKNGIEQYWNKSLKGIEGKRIVERNGLGEIINISEKETQPAVPGNNILLTINKNIQAVLEEELRDGIKTYGGISAVGVIVDPNTGEILALANVGDYDPNNYSKFTDEQRRNKIITDTYEPGSTFKSVSLAALLNEELCQVNERINLDNGVYRFHGVNIKDTHKHEWLTVRGIIEQSSNIGMAKLIQRIDDDTFYKYLRAFGFGSYTSIELPSESKGKLKMPADWGKLTKAFVSYGYEIAATPVQIAMAYCAIINGGILYQPQLIKKEVSPAGVVLYESTPREVRKVISSKTSEVMRDLLKGVVLQGSGKNAQSNIVPIGGKTGTTQKLVNGSYSNKEYNSSFAGFYPADNPKAVCVIVVNSPTIGGYGGLVAAPIFKKIAERTFLSNPEEFEPPKSVEDVKEEIKIIYAKESGIEYQKEFDDNHVKYNSKTKVMPDLTNYTIKEAIQVMTNLGVKYKIKGTGKIISQSIMPGEQVNRKMTCEITCSQKENTKVVVY